MCDDQLKETNLEILHRIILLIAYHIYCRLNGFNCMYFIGMYHESKKYSKGHFRALRVLQRSLQRLRDEFRHTMPPIVTPWTNPTPWTQPQNPIPLISGYDPIIKQWLIKKSPQKEEIGREKAVLPIGGWFEGHPSDLSLRRLHNQVVSDNCLAGGVEQ